MGFIREYAEMSGDPFRFRRPKWAKRLRPGRALGRLGRAALGSIPVVGSAVDFARSYGLMGDPDEDDDDDIDVLMGDPGPRRKQASSGPKAKAKTKAQHRAKKHVKAARATSPKRRGRKKGGGGLAAVAGAAGQFMRPGGGLDAITHAAGRLIPGVGAGEDALTEAGVMPDFGSLGGARGAARGHGFGGHRRTMNPANVKALRRAGRRLESFEKLVHRIAPHLLTAHSSRRRSSSTSRGHRPGCGCFACKKRK